MSMHGIMCMYMCMYTIHVGLYIQWNPYTVIREFFVVKKFSFCAKRRKFFTRKLFTSNIIYSEYMVHV